MELRHRLQLDSIASDSNTAIAVETQIPNVLEVATGDDIFFPYTTTLLVLWLLHSLYFIQRKQRRWRPLPTICYDDLVVRRRYEKVWLAALRTLRDDYRQPLSSTQPLSSSLTIPLGNNNNSLESTLPLTIPHQLYMILDTIMHHRLYHWLQAVGAVSALQLFYYTHLIWSCRALEAHFGSSWRYLSSLITVAGLSVGIRFGLINYVVHDDDPSRSSDRLVLRKKDLSSTPMRICAPIIVAFQLTFPRTAISVIPFFHIPHSNLLVPWIAISMFVVVEGSIREFVEGLITTFVWVKVGTPDFGLFAMIALVLMCHRSLESVGWDRRTGQLKVYDEEAREWTLYEPYLNTEVAARTDYTSANGIDDDDDRYDENSIAEESSTGSYELRDSANDEERASLVDNDALWRSNEVRSRRGPQSSD